MLLRTNRCVYSLQDTVSWRDSLTCSFLTGYVKVLTSPDRDVNTFCSAINFDIDHKYMISSRMNMLD